MRRPLLLALSILATTAACTSLLGDFTVKATTGDGGHVGDDGGGGGEGGTCNAEAANVAVYFGQKATLDGTKSTTTTGQQLQYSWAVDVAPPGSMITTSNLTGGSTATPSFTPDVLGVYQLVLTVTAGDCPASNAPATVTAQLPQVLYAQGNVTGSGPQATYVVADLDGGTPHPVICPDTVTTSVTNEIATFAAYGGRAYDFWEAPAGTPSNFAAFTVDYQAGNYSTHLYAGTTADGCDASPSVNLGAAGFGPSPFGSEPRFSPDGSRFAVYDASWNVLTYAANGTAQHSVAAYSAGQAGSPTFDTNLRGSVNEPPRIAWQPSGSGVAWARSNATGWEVVTANDQPSATPVVSMTCPGVTPREIALLKDGSIIASYRATPTSGENLFQLTIGSQGACQVKHQYTSVGDAAGAIATDFDVSPDQSTLAFLQLDPTTQDASLWSLPPTGQYPGGYVYTVSVDDTAPAHQLSPKPAIFGPRWIGGGTLLVFTGLDSTSDARPPATSIVVIAPDGGGQSTIAQGDGVTTFVSTSGNGACSVVTGRVGPAGAALVALGALAALLRGRRRRR
jgi:hypothetical protein